MPQHPAAHDETVRMRSDGPAAARRSTGRAPRRPARQPADAGRRRRATRPVTPRPAPRRTAPDAATRCPDDTRPATRDWRSAHPRPSGRATGVTRPLPTAADPPSRTRADDAPRRAGRSPPDPTTAPGRRGPVAATAGDASTDRASAGGDGPGHPRRSRRPATSRPPTARAARGGGAAPSSSRPAPSPCWPPLYGVDLLVASGDIPRSPSSPASTSAACPPPPPPTHAGGASSRPRVAADHTVVADDVEATLSPATAGITLDVDGTVDAADDQPLNPWTRLVTLFSDREVDAGHHRRGHGPRRPDRDASPRRSTAPRSTPRSPSRAPRPAWSTPADGRALDRDGAAEAITDALAAGGDPETPIELPVEVTPVARRPEEAAAGPRRDGHARRSPRRWRVDQRRRRDLGRGAGRRDRRRR